MIGKRKFVKVMKIKVLLIGFLMVVGLNVSAQSISNESQYFAQGVFPSEDVNYINSVEADIRALPFVEVVRLDHYSGRFFILTSSSMSSLSDEELRSWFGSMGETLSCVQIGIHGIDPVAKFPFENCSE